MNSIAIEGHFDDYTQLSWVFFLCIIGGFVIWLFVYSVYRRLKKRHESNLLVPASQDPEAIAVIIRKEKHRAAEIIGKDTVYKYFIEDGRRAWFLSFASVGIQLWMCFVFITGSEYDFRKDTSDLVYTWQCPRDQVDCTDSNGRDWMGWVPFCVLMATYLLKNIINGTKLVVIAIQGKSPLHQRVKFLFCGLCFIVAASFTLFASTIYNQAIATTNTELIANAVIILFITDIDEMLFDLLTVINPRWSKVQIEQDSDARREVKEDCEEEEEGDVTERLRKEMKSLFEDEKNKWKAEWETEMKIELGKQVQAELGKSRQPDDNSQVVLNQSPVVKVAQEAVANME